jgi:hypothetical protein
VLEDPHCGDLSAAFDDVSGTAAAKRLDRLPGTEPAGVQPHVGDLLPARRPVDLEHAGPQPRRRAAGRGREELLDGGQQLAHALAEDGRAEVHRDDQRLSDLSDQLGSVVLLGEVRVVAEVGLQERVAILGQHVRHLRAVLAAGQRPRRDPGGGRAQVGDRAHRDPAGGELVADAVQQLLVAGTGAIYLVGEDEDRDPQAGQRPHQDAGLRLHSFDGRDHEDGAVEYPQGSLHLRDKVRVPRRVNKIDLAVVDGERHHGRPDGDAPSPLHLHGVGLRAAGIDAADPIDDTSLIKKALGQTCLSCVNMRDDPDVEGIC